MKSKNKNKGILFWITGLSGTGKTTLGKKIHKDISKIYGPTIMVSGDDIRKIFTLKGYNYNERLVILKKYSLFAKYITEQKINIILTVVGMIEEQRKWKLPPFIIKAKEIQLPTLGNAKQFIQEELENQDV